MIHAADGDMRVSSSGLLPADGPALSMLCRRSVLYGGGLRAMLLQAVHPDVAAAVESTGEYLQEPWARHARTVETTLRVLLGERQDALAAVRRVNALHAAVSLEDKLGNRSFPAKDSDLLLWVHVSLVSSFLVFESLTVGRLSPRERDLVCEELGVVGRLLGVDCASLPRTVADIDEYVSAIVSTGDLCATASSDILCRTLTREAPLRVRILMRPLFDTALATLPDQVRLLYPSDLQGLVGRWTRRPSASVLRGANRILPGRLTAVRRPSARRGSWQGARSPADVSQGPDHS
ncbi:oxygenase MpaB family protein [Pedococcus sp. 5OH_020]|uniref:oxygenase MpaB family protein n=1 Tax=Pedococcus sp. 5OH_020 TaxID=2989814 RepID=UPI0022E9CD45|nr:oxygenase MpaB family protein [Pedococcus sp. 5OH_020]